MVSDEETEKTEKLTAYNRYAILVLVISVIGFAIARFLHFELSDLGLSPQFILFIGAPLILFLAFLRIEIALVFFVYTIPIVTYSIPGLPFHFTFADAFLILLVAVWLSRAVLKKEYTLYQTFLDRYLLFFIFLSVFSLFNSRVFGDGVRELIQTVEFFVFSYYFFCTVAKRRDVILGVFQAITFSSAFFSLYGIHQYFVNGMGDFRIYSMMGHFNAFGAYVALMMLLIFNFMLSERNRFMRWVYITVLGVNFIALMLTYSRGAWIAVVAGVIVSAWLRGLTQFVKVFTILIVFLIVLSMVVPTGFVARFTSITKFTDQASIIRLKQYKIAADTMTSYPLLGVGLSSMGDYVWQEYGFRGVGEIHNLFLMVGSERGVPAMLTLIAIFALFFLKAKKRIDQTDVEPIRSYYIGLFTAILTFFIINLTAVQLVRGTGIFFGMLLGLFQAVSKLEDEEDEEARLPYYAGRATTMLRG